MHTLDHHFCTIDEAITKAMLLLPANISSSLLAPAKAITDAQVRLIDRIVPVHCE
jgi:hypothetical protein